MAPNPDSSTDPVDVKLSVTDMFNCHHGPVPNCPRCLVTELVGALAEAKLQMATAREIFRTQQDKEIPMQRGLSDAIFTARAVLAKAKRIDPEALLAEAGAEQRAVGAALMPDNPYASRNGCGDYCDDGESCRCYVAGYEAQHRP